MKTHAMATFSILLVLVAATGTARASTPVTVRGDQGVLVRAGGDVHFGPDERASAIVVLGGQADIQGHTDSLLVVGGDAVLEGAVVGDLTVVDGRAVLRPGTVVTGNLRLVSAELERDSGARVVGSITRESSPRWGFFPFGLLFALGASAAVVLAGLAALVLAPRGMARAAASLRERPGRTLLAGALVWFAGPPLAVACMVTIVGIPAGVGALFFVLPALAFVGYLVSGHALGGRLLELAQVRVGERTPYLASALGLVVLMLLGALPVAGALIGLGAAFAGGGAIARVAWSTFRGRGAHGDSPVASLPLVTPGPIAHP